VGQRTCSIRGCGKPVRGHGFCNAHYLRWYRFGDPLGSARPTPDERFDAKWTVDPETGCHVWQASFKTSGYGQFGFGGKMVPSHIYAYVRKYGPVPEGLELDHFRCDHRACCNPDHVRPVTPRENNLRGNTVTSAKAAQTHCIHGHILDGVRKDGRRFCRECSRIFMRRYLRERRAAQRAKKADHLAGQAEAL